MTTHYLTRRNWQYNEVQPATRTHDNNDNALSFPPQPDTVEFVVRASAEDVTRWLSALLIGAEIAYPEQAVDVAYSFIRYLDDPIGMVLDCNEVLACLLDALQDNNDANGNQVRDVIRDIVRDELPGVGPDGIPLDRPDTLADGGPACDYDKLFAYITQLVDFSETIVIDALQIIESATSNLELMETVSKGVPITDAVGVDAVLEYFDNALENLDQSFTAGYTAQLRDEIRCDLFQLACNSCDLTWTQVATYFTDRFIGDLFDRTATDWIVDFFDRTLLTDRDVVDGFFALLWFSITTADRFFDVEASWFVRAIRALNNDSDSDWNVLCDPCAPEPWTYTFDFAVSSYNWNLDYEWRGDWQQGVGIVSNDYRFKPLEPVRSSINIRLDFTQTTILSLTMETELISGNRNSARIWIENERRRELTAIEAPNGVNTWTGNKVGNAFEIFVMGSQYNTAGECRLYSLTVTGIGPNPFE